MRRGCLAMNAGMRMPKIRKTAANNVARIRHRRRVYRNVPRRFYRDTSVLRKTDERINAFIQKAADIKAVRLIKLAPRTGLNCLIRALFNV